jgi:hypothetical protein
MKLKVLCIKSVYFTTSELPSGAGTVNFLGEGVDNQLRRNQLTRAPKPTEAHCDTVNSTAIAYCFFDGEEKEEKMTVSKGCCLFDRCKTNNLAFKKEMAVDFLTDSAFSVT